MIERKRERERRTDGHRHGQPRERRKNHAITDKRTEKTKEWQPKGEKTRRMREKNRPIRRKQRKRERKKRLEIVLSRWISLKLKSYESYKSVHALHQNR